MGTSRRLAPLAYNSVVALAGAAAIYALARSFSDDAAWVGHREPAKFDAAAGQPQVNRLAFVQPGAFSQSQPASDAPLTTSGVPAGTDDGGSWSTETQPEATTPLSAPGYTLLPSIRLPWQAAKPNATKQTYTLKTRLAELSPDANLRLVARFGAAKAAWPPGEIALVALKDQKQLELHARTGGGAWSLIHRYRVLAASGGAGPKLRQGDRQVPEGIYGIMLLNPNSAYHVSLRVNYPNAFDRQMAALDGRKDLGGDIMIHGKNLSAGCLAIGDEAVEELFVLAAQTGLANIRLIIAPTDLRENSVPVTVPGQPAWIAQLHADIAAAMAPFKAPRSPGLLSFFMR